ncbi:hypothetical protein TRIP_B330037 [uncultured Desulfatiglans sp.]|nr:hypothetical protein TRIP_B330037 [uncultured Desulfatiglans sp.]
MGTRQEKKILWGELDRNPSNARVWMGKRFREMLFANRKEMSSERGSSSGKEIRRSERVFQGTFTRESIGRPAQRLVKQNIL